MDSNDIDIIHMILVMTIFYSKEFILTISFPPISHEPSAVGDFLYPSVDESYVGKEN